ncbi:hypothetical protein GFL39_25900 [Rhizobium leguminosarum bv. viciae]|uniref:hypothetical protein n=1 Tax=Rhizobium leguminosarum TaxID=384 RepID=UPI001442919C|nr:hypothetical protein [Rhizobium leguminosarum]NKL08306.1 hypothetical protein [Rhizobium leguminosarum bv. viciae]
MAAMPSIKLNKETLGLVIACFSVAGSIFAAYNWLLAGRAENAPIVRQLVLKDQMQDKRLDRTDEDRAITKELSQKTGELKEAVVKLTTVLENTPTRKAEYYFENAPRPGVPSPTIEVRR